MNDPDYSTYGYGEGYSTASYQTVGAVYADEDPLFGTMPGADTGLYAETGTYDTTAYYAGAAYGGYAESGHSQNWDSGAYQAYPEYQQYVEYVEPTADLQVHYEPEPEPEYSYETYEAPDPEPAPEPDPAITEPVPEPATEPEPVPAPLPGAASRAAARSRRRRPAKRSALLTVAVPSVAVMGVAACAAATVTTTTDSTDTSNTQADAATSTVTTKLDQQLAGVSRDADDFADRASRTQERIDLKERQAAEKRKKAEEAAAREAARPKFALPVSDDGLSAYYGQAGVNWMSVHTGVDFPVSYGTPVMAATDGTVRTQWNGSYGNMAIVTAADGTETWYAHLSSTKIRSGSVKAGDVIAYSGNSGNSTGPHLHFEVHPVGGSAIDPLQWLLNKGLDPR